MKKVGIWGAGVVGTATGMIFEHFCPDKVKVTYYDKFKDPYKNNAETLLEESEFVFICLPTPMKVTGEIDLGYIKNALHEIDLYYRKEGRSLNLPIIIIRSTSVSGSTDRLANEHNRFDFAFCPEFLTEKSFIDDALTTNRVIIGTHFERTYLRIYKLFHLAFGNSVSYFHLSPIEAETLKYMSNVFLAGQVMLANEIYFTCRVLGVNYERLRKLLRFDPRIGSFTKVPGHDGDFGIGGKCFPKDLSAFVHLANEKGYMPEIMETMIKLNDRIRKNKDWLQIPGAHEDCNYEKGEEG